MLYGLSIRCFFGSPASLERCDCLAFEAGGSVLAPRSALTELVAELRRSFALDSVAILAPEGSSWRVVASAGASVPETPELANFCLDLDEGTMLVLGGAALSAEDARLLTAFASQLRIAQERLVLESGAAAAGELAEANDLRSALLAAVSHDLRTPLASIKAAVTSVLSSEVTWDPDDVEAFCLTINEETDRLTGIVSNLLDMSRLQTGILPIAFAPVEVGEVIGGALASLSGVRNGARVELPENLPLVQTDFGLLERVLANVISNAEKWSPAEVPPRIEAGVVDDHVDIRIVDRGPGIPRSRHEDAFRPFQQTGDGARDELRGVGLGLAVAKGFTEAVGGELTLDDTPGGGTTVVLSLPRAI